MPYMFNIYTGKLDYYVDGAIAESILPTTIIGYAGHALIVNVGETLYAFSASQVDAHASRHAAAGADPLLDADLPKSWTLAAPSGDHAGDGIMVSLVANEAQAIGDLCYIGSGSKAYIAKADLIADANGLVMVAQATIGAGATGNYIWLGIVRDDSWSWAVGGKVFLSTTGTTGNTLTQAPPSGANNVIQIIGVALTAHVIMFVPNLVQVEHT